MRTALLGFTLVLASLGVAAIAKAAEPGTEPNSAPVKSPRRPPHLYCVLIGGMDSDPSPEQIAGTAPRDVGNSGLYRLRGDLQVDRVTPEYFNWNGTHPGDLNNPQPPRSAGIVERMREHCRLHPRDRVAIVGNSWGGHTAHEVARDLAKSETPLAIDLMVFLDPSSAGRTLVPPKGRPITVNASANYFTRNRFVWGPLKIQESHENIDLGDPGSGYLREEGPKYDAPFDFPAHVAAEWDERIHADIRRRLLKLISAD
ncbi:MAG: hypothetical protein NT069_31065 [Planctomycetota bacterium]|nr:hypothetical protein [Planctomycetota bacterium]